ncbi:hypothetical protein; putative signal peptide [Bradyrhizobium sp. ORS 278]|uniref:hypothetical protein n=1 Tax=Bradyrhizobium sp. (strain ORS 278) TaxID=114615 RepID=UPI0001507F69|nr:hypothetical protein [Bradyrhizobium sp. ORS 278]CAL78701.1 hypothetical protein; putative signal peptide [Bradyrhizobium sp. ORS 278]
MRRQHRPETFAFTTLSRWLAGLATTLLARSLNLPEPLLHATGSLVVAQVSEIEARAARSLCPARLRRRFLAWFR